MKKLNWKKRYLNDKSGHWFSAYVKPLNWEYVVETGYCSDRYYCFLFVNKYSDEEVKISKKTFKKLEDAQKCCEKHLIDTANKLNLLIKS